MCMWCVCGVYVCCRYLVYHCIYVCILYLCKNIESSRLPTTILKLKTLPPNDLFIYIHTQPD